MRPLQIYITEITVSQIGIRARRPIRHFPLDLDGVARTSHGRLVGIGSAPVFGRFGTANDDLSAKVNLAAALCADEAADAGRGLG